MLVTLRMLFRKSKESTFRGDGQTLNYDEEVLPLRNIAYFKKWEAKGKSGVGKVLLTTVLVLAASVVATVVTRIHVARLPILGLMLLALGGFYIFWIVYLVRRRNEYALVLQTNAGDSSRLLTSQDEQSLDNLIPAIPLRLVPGNDLPPLIGTINDNSIKIGDVTNG